MTDKSWKGEAGKDIGVGPLEVLNTLRTRIVLDHTLAATLGTRFATSFPQLRLAGAMGLFPFVRSKGLLNDFSPRS